MKRTLLAALLLVGLMGASAPIAHAYSADQVVWKLTDTFGADSEYEMAMPNGIRFLAFDGVNQHPTVAQLGAGLVWDGTTIVPTGLTYDAIPGLQTDFNSKSNVGHAHVASDITNFSTAVDARIASSTAGQSDWNETATSSQAYIKNKPTLTFATTTRSLNTAFKISSASASIVSYTVDVATTLSLTGGQTGTVTLEYADDSAFTTNVKTVQSSVNGNTGTLTIGLALTQTSTASLSGVVPANKWVRISTANTAGTPTFTYRTQQEVLLPL